MVKILLISVMCCLTGCSMKLANHHMLEDNSVSIEKFNWIASGQNATIVFRDSSEVACHHVRLSEGQVYWIGADSNTRSRPAADIKKIVILNHSKGAARGIGIGAISGAAEALKIVSSEKDVFMQTLGIIVFLPAFTVVGAIGGFVYGIIVGYSDTYEQ